MRPKSIRRFEFLFLLQAAASILAILVNYGQLRQQAINAGASPSGPIGGVLLTLLVGLPLWFFIARRASNIAKWVMVLLSGLTFLTLPGGFAKAHQIGISYELLFGLSIVGWFAALAMLFRCDASAWLKSRGKSQEVDPKVFS